MESKEDGTLTATCQVGGHAQFSNIIPMPNGDTEGVAQHFLEYHTDLNVRNTLTRTHTHLPLCHGHKHPKLMNSY
jgi:hypothetical protein